MNKSINNHLLLIILNIYLFILISCNREKAVKDNLFGNFIYNMTLNPDTFPKHFIIEKGSMEFFIKRVIKDGRLKRIELIDSSCSKETFEKYVNLYQQKYNAMTKLIVYDTHSVNSLYDADNIQWNGLNPDDYMIVSADPFDEDTKYPHSSCLEVCGLENNGGLNMGTKKLTVEQKLDKNKFCGFYHLHLLPKKYQSLDRYDDYGKPKPIRHIKIYADPKYKNYKAIVKKSKYQIIDGDKMIELIHEELINSQDLVDIHGESNRVLAAWEFQHRANLKVIYSFPQRELREEDTRKLNEKKYGEKIKKDI